MARSDAVKRYTIGVDFGSLSARAVLMDLDTGGTVGSTVYDYPHGVLTERLPDGTPLGPDWALQDPEDYWNAFPGLIPPLLKQCGVTAEQVAGLGLDVTSCTLLPTTADGTPLCCLPEFAARPHAWVKLWKHHAAQSWAPRIDALAAQRGEPWLGQFGGRVSGEYYLPKAAQIAAEDPALYRAAERIPEMGDWLVWRLCGRETRGSCAAAFKTFWNRERGDVSREFLSALHPLLADLNEKHPGAVVPPGSMVGGLTEEAARWTGLLPGTAVSAAGVDAHVTLLGGHMGRPGELLLIIGTSTCAILNSDVYREVPGLNGVVPEGILPGLNAYEGGQSCVGDLFAWFTENCVPAAYAQQAQRKGKSLHQLLLEKAAALAPGESGLVALDWWNGVRSTLMDFDLSGVVAGLTLSTRPEHLYRALLEATAYGVRRIIDAMEDRGVPVTALYAAGGIPSKNPLLMQIYADVCGREVYLTEEEHSGALGSAVLAASAALWGGEGFAHLAELTERYRRPCAKVYRPVPAHREVCETLYGVYSRLYRRYGQEDGLLKELKAIRLTAR